MHGESSSARCDRLPLLASAGLDTPNRMRDVDAEKTHSQTRSIAAVTD